MSMLACGFAAACLVLWLVTRDDNYWVAVHIYVAATFVCSARGS